MRMRIVSVLVVLGVLASACGSSSKSSSSSSSNPDANKLQATVASFDLTAAPDPQRLLVGLEMGDGRLIGFGTVHVQVHPEQTKATGATTLASFLAIPGTEAPQPPPSTPQLVDALHGRGVYSANVVLSSPGTWLVDVEGDVQGLGHVTASSALNVNATHTAVAVGETPPAVKTYTVADHADAPLAAVDSRAQQSQPVPDPELHAASIDAALGTHRPLVVVFSTPVYCQSRFCGPITDMVEDVARSERNKATFIHIEIYTNFQTGELNPGVSEWLQKGGGEAGEPWVFVVGSDGKVSARFDNVVTRDELVGAINAVK